MWDVKACRSCLTVKGKLEKIGEASKRQYTAITGLQISDSDSYPNFFCMECRHHIRKSLAFRRKSRRAHFVLKEIMSVRKQVSFSDIVTVNRKKTNLESSLNFWEPNNNACYLIANEEGQEEESLQKYNLEPIETSTNTNSKHLIDIKPEIDETEIDNEIPAENQEESNEVANNDDIPSNDYLEPELDLSNIDMNDIFKDFTETFSDDDTFSLMEETPKTRETNIPKVRHVHLVAESLLAYDITVLTVEEQREKMQLQKRQFPYVTALYKCAMCVSVKKNMQELLEHVAYHNERKFNYDCHICKNKFPAAEDLNWHIAQVHLYEYRCKLCPVIAYSLTTAVNHMKLKHDLRRGDNRRKRTRRTGSIKAALSTFTITPLAQQTMSDIMMLRARQRGKNAMLKSPVPSSNNWLQCDICHIFQKTKHDMERHMTLSHRSMYTCNECKEVFTERKQAVKHFLSHERIECKECNKKFKREYALNIHTAKCHSVLTPCNLCGAAVRAGKSYYTHQLRQHRFISLNHPLLGDPQHKCRECEVQFIDKKSLEKHLVVMNHEGVDSIDFACIPCKKIFEDMEQLETHYITCNYSRKYPRTCCYCSKLLHNSCEYKQHYYNEHPNLQYRYVANNAICDVCGKSIYKPFLETHLKTHTGGAFECRLCPTISNTAASHVTHLLACHACQPYRCGMCPRRFQHRSNCKDHILKVHAPTKLYKCEFCGAEFSYFRHLKDHSMNLHNLVIPTIKSGFILKSHKKIFVYAHMKIEIHDKEKPIVEQVDIELVDYLDQKSKLVNYSDYFIFNPEAEETIQLQRKLTTKMKKARRRLQRKVDEVAEIKNEPAEEKCESKVNVLSDVKIEVKHSVKMDSEYQDSEMNSVVYDNEQIFKQDVEPMILDQDITDTDPTGMDGPALGEMPLEVIESEGHQYVMIDGEMYRIACEDEE